jgi:hypothetical protein
MKVKTAKAAILAQSRQPLVVDEITLPAELNVGQVLVKILQSTRSKPPRAPTSFCRICLVTRHPGP